MRRLHETTRKRICCGAFFAVCVAPTCATLAWAIHWHMPWQEAERAERIGRPLHAQATLAGWREPRPGVVRVADAKLVDLATQTGLVKAVGVESRLIGGVTVLTAERIAVDAADLPRVVHRIEEMLAAAGAEVRELRIAEIVIRTGAGEQRLVDGVARLVSAGDGAYKIQAIVHARQAVDEKSAMRVIVERTAAAEGRPAQTTLTLDSTGAAISAVVLGDLLPGVAEFGADVTFAGRFDAQFVSGSAAASQAKGRLAGLDVAAIFPTGSPHIAAGSATVELDEASWRDGSIVRLAGKLNGRDLSVSRSLVIAANTHLSCAMAPTSGGAGPQELIPVDELAATFVFDATGLTIWGVCPKTDSVPAGCLATRGGRPLAMQPDFVNLQSGRWVNFLTAESPLKMSATPQTLEAARRLPWPGDATTK